MIRLEKVSKQYPGTEVAVLREIDLEIGDGDFVSIVGRSGSGKTTLLHLVGGLDGDFDGSVQVDGREIGTLGDVEISTYRSRTIGFVFQNDHLLDHLCCRDNVSLASLFSRGEEWGSADAVRNRTDELLAQVGLEGSGDRLSTTLSGGERQRVAFARALFNRPRVLLCDEPTGNLDTGTAADLVGLLTKLHRKHEMTIVTVTHDEAISTAGQRTLELSDGRLDEFIKGPR